MENLVKFLSMYKTVNIYTIASNGFHDELFNDNKEMETEQCGSYRRSYRYCLEKIEKGNGSERKSWI